MEDIIQFNKTFMWKISCNLTHMEDIMLFNFHMKVSCNLIKLLYGKYAI